MKYLNKPSSNIKKLDRLSYDSLERQFCRQTNKWLDNSLEIDLYIALQLPLYINIKID